MHHLHIMAKHAVSSFVISFSMSYKFVASLLSLSNALIATRLDFNIQKSKNKFKSIDLLFISIILIYCNQLNKNTFLNGIFTMNLNENAKLQIQ